MIRWIGVLWQRVTSQIKLAMVLQLGHKGSMGIWQLYNLKSQAVHPPSLRLAMASIPREAQTAIIEIMDTYSDKLVLGWDKIKTFCLSSTPKLAWRQRIPPHVIGMCVANRSGTLGDVTRSHELGAKIQAQGFVESKTEGATCFVAPSDSVLLEQTVRENSKASPIPVGSAVAELRNQ